MNLKEITASLNAAEPHARKLEVPDKEREELIDSGFQYADKFISSLDELHAFQPSYPETDYFANESVIEDGQSFSHLLEILDEYVDHPGLNPASGGHLGYIPGGGIFPSAIADFMAAVFNRYAGIHFASPGAVKMENFLIRWIANLFGYPSTAAGHLSSGGSIANLTAIVTARDAANISAPDFPSLGIYLTDQAHHCIEKAIRIAGLGESQIQRIKMDPNYRMDTVNLRKQIHADIKDGITPFLIVAAAGTTDTGAVDPLEEIGEIAAQHDIWYHIDAAYGGFFKLLDPMQSMFKGIQKSDSLVVDPHKGLFLPYGIGAVVVKDAHALKRSHQYEARYMQDAQQGIAEFSPAEISPELTKHFRGLRMWLPLKLLGLKPFKSALWEKILLARYFYEKLSTTEGFELGPYPDLSVVIYRYQPSTDNGNRENLELAKLVQNDGRVFISSTTINKKVWLRLAVLSFRTHRNTIDLLLEILQEKVKQL